MAGCDQSSLPEDEHLVFRNMAQKLKITSGPAWSQWKTPLKLYIETQRLNITCTVFQAELCGINMAVEWIQHQRQKSPSYAINVDSKTALLAIANKRTTHPLAVATRKKIIELRTST